MNGINNDIAETCGQKIALLGDPGVGKTALALSLCGREFSPKTETHSLSRLLLTANREISIIDFSGETSASDIRNCLEREVPTIVLVVVTTFHNDGGDLRKYMDRWLPLIPQVRSADTKRVNKFLVASQGDLVTQNRSDIEENGNLYGFDGTFLTSAKNGDGIHQLRKSVLDAVSENEDEIEDTSVVALVVLTMTRSLCELVARNPSAIDEIEWRDIERLIATALEGIGFSVELTRPAMDGGKDVIANCVVENLTKSFYVEIKHWRSGVCPGMKHISEFVEVIARDGIDGGLFLSSSGFADPVYGRMGEILRQRVRLGKREKIVSLCQQYVRRKQGMWYPVRPLPDTLFEETLV